MENLPERSSLRCGDSDRQKIVDVLNTAYAEGRLSLDEHDERTSAAWAAKTFGELTPLTADLQITRSHEMAPVHEHTALVRPNPGGRDSWTAIMGTQRLQGSGAVLPERSTANAVLGDVVLDLSQGGLAAHDCTINANIVMGDLKLTVPAGVNVEVRTTTAIGDAKTSGLRPGGPGAPTVVITGFVLMGDVKVYGPDHVPFSKRLGLGR